MIGNNVTCSVSICSSLSATVNCITNVLQGTDFCTTIQFYGKDDLPLDLRTVTNMHIRLNNELECPVADFWYPSVPIGSDGFLLEILQTEENGIIFNKGLVKICIPKEYTQIIPGNVTAEFILTGNFNEDGNISTIGISCLQIAKILESKILKNRLNSPYVSQPNYFTIGSTGATGFIGATGFNGFDGATGFIGATGFNGFDGATGFIGATGFDGATGEQGFTGATGLNYSNTDWQKNSELIIREDQQLSFLGDYVLENSFLYIEGSTESIEYSPDKYFSKIGKLFVNGNILLKDSTIQNNGIIQIKGSVILIGNSQIIGNGIIT